MKCSISYLKANDTIENTIKKIDTTDADFIHVDIMDGKFVENATGNLEDTIAILKKANKPLDVHLMVADPLSYIEMFQETNTNYITFHIELQNDVSSLIDHIHNASMRAGLALNPNTPISMLDPFLESIDLILIMGVNPGKGGQKLIPETILKIKELEQLRRDYNYHYLISLDGGVNQETRVLLDGLDIIVAGSYICMSDNYQERIDTLR